MKKTIKSKSTFEREIKNPKFKKKFDKDYSELLLSELVLAMMEEDQMTVRKLAKAAGLAPSVVQSVRSGRHSNMTLKNFMKLISVLGGEVAVKRGDSYVHLKLQGSKAA